MHGQCKLASHVLLCGSVALVLRNGWLADAPAPPPPESDAPIDEDPLAFLYPKRQVDDVVELQLRYDASGSTPRLLLTSPGHRVMLHGRRVISIDGAETVVLDGSRKARGEHVTLELQGLPAGKHTAHAWLENSSGNRIGQVALDFSTASSDGAPLASSPPSPLLFSSPPSLPPQSLPSPSSTPPPKSSLPQPQPHRLEREAWPLPADSQPSSARLPPVFSTAGATQTATHTATQTASQTATGNRRPDHSASAGTGNGGTGAGTANASPAATPVRQPTFVLDANFVIGSTVLPILGKGFPVDRFPVDRSDATSPAQDRTRPVQAVSADEPKLPVAMHAALVRWPSDPRKRPGAGGDCTSGDRTGGDCSRRRLLAIFRVSESPEAAAAEREQREAALRGASSLPHDPHSTRKIGRAHV